MLQYRRNRQSTSNDWRSHCAKFDGTDLFLLKGGAKSDDDDISCAINENLHSLSYNQGQDLIPIGNVSDLLNTTEPTSNPTSSPTSSPTSRPTSEPEPTIPSTNETIPNYYHRNHKSSGGLSRGLLAAIVISIIVALIALIALIVVFIIIPQWKNKQLWL